MGTLSTLQQRYLDLIGDPDGTIDSFGTRNINAAISDIINKYAFSWNVSATVNSLSTGAFDLSANFNPIWGIADARVTNSGTADDYVFVQVPIWDKDKYGSSDYVYWLTYDGTAGSENYVFNTPVQSGDVIVTYQFRPEPLANSTDVCVVPDDEAVSYAAASKNWIGSERDVQLKQEYERMADRYITALYLRDLQSGPTITVKPPSSINPGLLGYQGPQILSNGDVYIGD